MAELENYDWSKDDRLRQLEENREKTLQAQLERITRVVEDKANSEIYLKRMQAFLGKGELQDRESELRTFTYHITEFNRAWYTLPTSLPTSVGSQKKRGHPVCEFHCLQILNRDKNKNKKSEV